MERMAESQETGGETACMIKRFHVGNMAVYNAGVACQDARVKAGKWPAKHRGMQVQGNTGV